MTEVSTCTSIYVSIFTFCFYLDALPSQFEMRHCDCEPVKLGMQFSLFRRLNFPAFTLACLPLSARSLLVEQPGAVGKEKS